MSKPHLSTNVMCSIWHMECTVKWITQYQDDYDIDELIAALPIGKAQSYKCKMNVVES
jgi:hypothetical protein